MSPKHGFKIIKSSAKNQDGSPARPHVDVMDSMRSTSDSRVPDGAYTAVSSEAEEEAENHPVIRMLLDPEGRLRKYSHRNLASGSVVRSTLPFFADGRMFSLIKISAWLYYSRLRLQPVSTLEACVYYRVIR